MGGSQCAYCIRRSPTSPLMEGEEWKPLYPMDGNVPYSSLKAQEGRGTFLIYWIGRHLIPEPLTDEWRVTVCIHAVNLTLWYEGEEVLGAKHLFYWGFVNPGLM